MKELRLALLILLTAGCGGIQLDKTNPPGNALSGVWELDAAASDPAPDFRRNRVVGDIRPNRGSARRQAMRIALGSGLAFVVQDFEVLRAEELVIELNRDSMGIQHTPGVYRDVSWGERQRGLWEVNAGWEENTLVILSSADGLRVMERMQQQGDVLRIEVQVKADGEERSLVRVFNRR